MDAFPTSDELRATLQRMYDLGPRHTGTAADHAWIDYLEQRMKGMGLEGVARDEVRITGANGFTDTAHGAPTSGTAHHLHGFLPGVDASQYIVLGVHSDGQNTIEESGTVQLIELVDYFSKMPKECRPYTMVLAFVTCHMAACDSAEARGFSLKHPEIMNRAAIFFAPEHAGHKYITGAKKGQVITQAINMMNSPSLAPKVESLVKELGITPYRMATERLGTSAGWATITGKPVLGSMSDWDTLSQGLVDIEVSGVPVDMDAVDADIFYKVTLLYGKMIGMVHGLSPAQMR